MKKDIHPKYFEVEVKCACGNVIKTRSTRKTFEISICSACHPFYTGADDHFVDAAGRVERFQRKFAWTGDKAQKEAARPRSKATKGRKPAVKIESRARGAGAPKLTVGEQKVKDEQSSRNDGAAKKDGSAGKDESADKK